MSDVYDLLRFFAPVYLAMIALEVWIGHRRGLKLYTTAQTVASLVLSIVQRLINLIPLNLPAIASVFFWEHKLIELPSGTWWYIPLLFLAVELSYYWYHRLSHEVRWMWATHSVHHSIEEMNILGAFRFGWTHYISLGGMIYVPLALLGFHPLHVLIALGLNLMYQSWLHTDLIGKLGPLEGILNTPSAHRVHHAKNAEYIDRNHGGVLMIYDRLFGTYEPERDDVPVEYGLINGPKTANPVRIAFHEWVNIARDVRNYPIQHWPGLLFGPPGWKPHGKGMTSAQLRSSVNDADFGCADHRMRFHPSPDKA